MALVGVALFFWIGSADLKCPFRSQPEVYTAGLVELNKKLEAERVSLGRELDQTRAQIAVSESERWHGTRGERWLDRERQRKLNDRSPRVESYEPSCRVPKIKIPAGFPYQD